MKRIFTLLFALLLFSNLIAQQYPVNIIPRVKAPAPVNFFNYADDAAMDSPITVQIFLNDLTVANRQIRLKTYFEGGNIKFNSRDFVIGAQDLFLEGGIPLTLTNAELAPYYRFENIEGISQAIYGRSIPEGNYNFCFEVFDFISGAKLSDKKCATVFIFKNEPPILNLPLNGSNIEPKDFENIVFQWTPRHISVSNVEYDFSIVEIWDNNVDPQTAFLSQPPIYEETVRTTSIIYGPDKPLLLAGRKYAWRVKAKALQGLEEIGLFKNEGYSEVFWFSRTAPCQIPVGVTAEPKGTSKINVFWDQDPTVHSEYIIAYREANNPDANWFTKRTNSAWATIWDLKAGTTYEYKVKGKCKYQFSDYSELQYVTTDIVQNENANYNCGIVPDEVAITNRSPHPGLNIGDVITAGDFKVTITEIQGQANGSLSGKGFVAIPYLKFAKFGVTFSNILVNTSNQLAEGEIITLYDPKFGEGASMTVDVNVNITEGITGDQGGEPEGIEVDFVVSDITIDSNGAIVVTGTNGETATVPGNDDVKIISSNGDVWSVGEDGTITQQEGAEGGAVTEGNTNGLGADGSVTEITAKGIKVKFKNTGFYHFDELVANTSDDLEKEYKVLNIEGGKYIVPYKAISDNYDNGDSNSNDYVNAEVDITDENIKTEDVIFKTKDGIKIPVEWDGNIAKLLLKRKFDYADEEILAVVKSPKDSTRYDIAGSLITTHLASEKLPPINITIVPLGVKKIDDKLKEQVREIYAKAGVRLNIQVAKDVLPDEVYGWDKNEDGKIEVGDSSALSNYTSDEAAFNAFIRKQDYYSKQTYYVFVTNIPTTKQSVDGFMPLKRQFGFVFINGIQSNIKVQARVMAHELGHGIFGLKHTWDQYQSPEGATDFLMDYSNGTVLNHLDWKKMHAPGIQIYWFQGDDDGQSAQVTSIPSKFKNIDGTYTFMTLNGSYITVPGNAKKFMFSTGLDKLDTFIDYPAGALLSFYIGDKKYRINVDRVSNKDKTNLTTDDLTYTYKGFNYKDGDYKKYSGSVITLIPFYKNTYTKNVVTGGEFGYSLNKRKIKLDFVENNSFNLIKNYGKLQKIYDAEIEVSKHYAYTTSAFPHQYQLNSGLMNEVITAGSWTKRHAILIKYGILNNAQPEIFKASVKEHFNKSYDVVFKDNDLKSLLEGYVPVINLMRSKSKGALEEFYSIVRNPNNGISTVKAYFYDLYKVISKLSSEQIESIKKKDRELAFKLLLKQEDNKYIFSAAITNVLKADRYENELLRLIKFIPKNEIDGFIEYLEEGINNNLDKDHLWHFAFHKIDDANFFWNKDNRKNFIKILTKHYYKSKRYKDELANFENWDKWKENGNLIAARELKRREIVGDYQSIYERSWNQLKVSNPSMFGFSPAKAYTKYDAEYEKNSGEISVEKNYSVGFMYNTKDDFTLAPFDLMYYRNQSKLANLRDYNSKDVVPLPAIVLYYDDNVQSLQTTGDVIQLSFDLATLAIPGGQLDKVGKILYLLDKASSIASIGSEVLKNDNPEASKLLNIISTAFGVADLTNITKVNSARKLGNTLKNNHDDYKSALDAIEKSSPETIAKFTDNNRKGVERLITLESQALRDAGEKLDEARIKKVLKKLKVADDVFDITKAYKGVKFKEFVDGTYKLNTFSNEIQKEVFRLWTKIDGGSDDGVDELFTYMKNNDVNLDSDKKTPWPPFNGFLKKPKIISGKEIMEGTGDFTLGKKFDGIYDRFQSPRKLANGDVESFETLGGGFASPVFKGEHNKIDIPYTYDTRALLDNIQEGTVYIKFRVKNADGLTFKYGEAIPWKNRSEDKLQGMAMQVQIEGMGFHSAGFKDKYDIIQKSVFRNGEWKHIKNDISIRVEKIMDNVKKCN